MDEPHKLIHPRLVAAWPGMGNVALNAGVYLLARLNMTMIAEFTANELFDVEHVDVKDGIVETARRPRHRLFLWTDPKKEHDLVVFLGEAQPPIGKYEFCRQLIGHAQRLGVERVFTFAAMATQMHPERPSRVFVAATDRETLDELSPHELTLLENGHVGGLNGILLGVAKESNLHGACLLGEMPHIFSQLPFPKASLAILRVFAAATGMQIDLTELEAQSSVAEERLGQLLAQVEAAYEQEEFPDKEEEFQPEAPPEDEVGDANRQRIEQLFEQARKDRAKAFELKQVLDRLNVFKEYEDRFLDLFKKRE